MSEKVSLYAGIIKLGACIRGPYSAGTKWVKYSREQAQAMMDITEQMRDVEQARVAAYNDLADVRESIQRELDASAGQKVAVNRDELRKLLAYR